MRMYDIIKKKRDGGELTPKEIHFFVDGYVKGEIPDYQASAFLMAVYYKGMTINETRELTFAVRDSGVTLDFSVIDGIRVDKHSTGGVGDKTSLVVAPIVASLGVKVAKMSGRGLGHTGGTIDKLESIPGFKTDLSNRVSSVNSGTILGRIAPGTYTIVWTLTDECGNPQSYTKNYIVNYPPCGTDLTAIDNDNNTYQTVRIGCECWTKSNLRTTTYSDGSDVAFARAYSSQAYPDTTANKANFGLLYTWYSAVNVEEGNDTAEPEVKTAAGSGYPYVQGVCPEGWAIPSMAQYYNAVSTVANIDGMKSTDINKWLPEHAGTDESGFSAVGAGFYNAGLGFESLLGKTWFWSYDQNIHTAQSASIGYYCNEMLNEEQPKGMGFSVRCIKRDSGEDTPTSAQACPGVPTVTDVDGNVYNTVQIGDQCWMRENLKTTKYANGTNIPLGTETSSTTAYRYHPDDNSANVSDYGYLYNWAAVMNGSASSEANPSGVQGICPTGWHVPSDAEWTELTTYVKSQSQYVCGGDEDNIAKALASEEGWYNDTENCTVGNNPIANNATGFSARPAGNYDDYYNFGSAADFWSATQNDSNYAYCLRLYYFYATVSWTIDDKNVGYSVRCVRN